MAFDSLAFSVPNRVEASSYPVMAWVTTLTKTACLGRVHMRTAWFLWEILYSMLIDSAKT